MSFWLYSSVVFALYNVLFSLLPDQLDCHLPAMFVIVIQPGHSFLPFVPFANSTVQIPTEEKICPLLLSEHQSN